MWKILIVAVTAAAATAAWGAARVVVFELFSGIP
jgi:hypothetical protein